MQLEKRFSFISLTKMNLELEAKQLMEFNQMKNDLEQKSSPKNEKKILSVLDSIHFSGDKKKRSEEFQTMTCGQTMERFSREHFHLKSFLVILNCKMGLNPIRQQWENAITGACQNVETSSNCLQCRGCWTKFTQISIVVKCASGVSDKVVIPHWASIFKTVPCNDCSLKEWTALPDEKFAAMCKRCSCWKKNTIHLKKMFRILEKTKRIPTSIKEVMIFQGFGLKSATLVLQTFFGKPFLVCVDRHLHRTFKKLNWVHHDSKSAEESSIQVSLWLDEREFINVNNVIASISQLLQCKKTREIVITQSKLYGVLDLVNKMVEAAEKKPKLKHNNAQKPITKFFPSTPSVTHDIKKKQDIEFVSASTGQKRSIQGKCPLAKMKKMKTKNE